MASGLPPRIRCIVNPVAGRGKGEALFAALESALRRHGIACNAVFTEGRGHGIELARQAQADGVETLAVVGGDGTLHDVINGLKPGASAGSSTPAVALLPAGTGDDFRRTLDLPRTPEGLAHAIAANHRRRIDIGALSYRAFDNRQACRYFINIADAGYGGALLRRAAGWTAILGASLGYLVALLVNLLFYQNPKMRVRVDGGAWHEGKYFAVVIANGQFFGGGMWIAPRAGIDDGDFECALIGNVTRFEVLRNLHRLYNGSLHVHPKVRYIRGRKIELLSGEEVLLEVDGELLGTLPATFEIIPGAVHLVAPPRR